MKKTIKFYQAPNGTVYTRFQRKQGRKIVSQGGGRDVEGAKEITKAEYNKLKPANFSTADVVANFQAQVYKQRQDTIQKALVAAGKADFKAAFEIIIGVQGED